MEDLYNMKKYNPQNAKEVETQSKLEPDTIYSCVITKIEEGITKDFLPEQVLSTWKGELDTDAINVCMQIKYGEKETDFIDFSQMFNLKFVDDGSVEYNKKSNLAKFKKKYGKLPEIGQLVKVSTNGEGKPKLKLD